MNCTVVIPTYNRPNHVKRILNYYHQYGSNMPIIIADSSSEDNKKLNREIVTSFHDAFITYLDKYDPSINGAYKVSDAMQQVNTKYCVIGTDDDFITPDSIQKSVEFLDLNPEYVSAYGNHIWFWLRYSNQGKSEFVYKYYESQAYMQEYPKERLLYKAMDASFITYHAVQSTALMQLFMREAAKITTGFQFAGAYRQTPDLLFAELLLFWLPPIYGKMKCLDTLYYMREECTPQNVSRVYITLPDLMNEPSYVTKLQEFSDCLSGHLSRQSGINMDEAQRIVEQAVAAYNRRTPALVLTVNKMLGKLHLPDWLDLTIRKIYRAVSAVIYPATGSGLTFPVKYTKELDRVRQMVLSTAKEIYGSGN